MEPYYSTYTQKISRPQKASLPLNAQRISGSDYHITPDNFSSAAISTVKRLQEAGFEAYIVGGGIRDVLLKAKPKDFDVATSATPEQIKPLFSRCFLIGRRFRLAHVHLQREVIEVSTFRADPSKKSRAHRKTEHGMILRDNLYGTLEEDALRRDFTANALYYDPTSNTILDYTDGLSDLSCKQLRMIGDPIERYREDPVRILRALRLSAKLHLKIEEATQAPIKKMAPLLEKIPSARLAEELGKLFVNSEAWACFKTLEHFDLLKILVPSTFAALQGQPEHKKLIELTLKNTAKRLKDDKSAHVYFVLAAFLWWPLQAELAKDKPFDEAALHVLRAQSSVVLITRRFCDIIREIWHLQTMLERPLSRQVNRTIEKKEFRAAYDFLLLRGEAGEDLQKPIAWWTDFIAADSEQREALIAELAKQAPTSRRRRYKKRTT